jgi:hypothetical protein
MAHKVLPKTTVIKSRNHGKGGDTLKLTLGMSNLKFSLSETHVNKMVIEGCITQIGVPSTGAPCGSDGKKIVFTQESVDANISTFDMMPVNCTFPEGCDWSWSPGTEVFTGHGETNIGVIEKAWSEGTDLMAKMVVWKALFPDIAFMAINGQAALGFSIECNANKTHDGIDDGYLYIDDFTGLGTAMLWKNTAAFEGTYIRELVANKQKDGNEMTEEQMKALLDAMMIEVKASVAEVKSSVETMVTEVKAEVDKANTQVEALAVGLVETREEIKASIVVAEPVVEPVVVEAAVVPVVAPTVLAAGQTVVPNGNITQTADEKALKIKEINASTMNPLEKAKAITKLKYAE